MLTVNVPQHFCPLYQIQQYQQLEGGGHKELMQAVDQRVLRLQVRSRVTLQLRLL